MNLRALGLAGLIVGVLFKLLHWPGAGTIVLFSALLTAVAIVLRIARRRVPWTIEISKPGWFAPSIVTALCGMMFKTLHWPGADILLMVGMIATAAWVLATQLRRALRPQATT
ncbi:MAG: hypothetical protein IPK70_16115 [Flavobacteriales bacterium]|jgi:O-antigen/teichoic acid export membrane protein|nr:hypothetical protein [Flavobacteriales bacterium]